MGRLIYSMLTSLDGFVADEGGRFGWAAPDAEVHGYANELAAPVGTYLFGRRMYEVMAFWETGGDAQDAPPEVRAFARHWRGADKVVFSRTLAGVRSARTRLERTFDPEAIRRLKRSVDGDLSVSGPELAAHALAAGLVDEIQTIAFPVVVGGGTRFYPDDLRLDLEPLEARRVGPAVALRYTVHGAIAGEVTST